MFKAIKAERFISNEPPPEGIERELLTILMEECAEVQQRASKMLRFGVKEVQPGQPLNNVDRLSIEIGDVMEVLRRCIDLSLVNAVVVEDATAAKKIKLEHFLQSEYPDTGA